MTDSALWPRPRVSVTAIASAQKPLHGAHRTDDDAERGDDGRQHDAGAEPIDEAADADREERSDERGPQVELRVIDAADMKIGDERLGDEAKSLRPSRQRADHGGGRKHQHHPPVRHAIIVGCVCAHVVDGLCSLVVALRRASRARRACPP